MSNGISTTYTNTAASYNSSVTVRAQGNQATSPLPANGTSLQFPTESYGGTVDNSAGVPSRQAMQNAVRGGGLDSLQSSIAQLGEKHKGHLDKADTLAEKVFGAAYDSQSLAAENATSGKLDAWVKKESRNDSQFSLNLAKADSLIAKMEKNGVKDGAAWLEKNANLFEKEWEAFDRRSDEGDTLVTEHLASQAPSGPQGDKLKQQAADARNTLDTLRSEGRKLSQRGNQDEQRLNPQEVVVGASGNLAAPVKRERPRLQLTPMPTPTPFAPGR